MTTKEKAEELVEKFYNAIPEDDFKGKYSTFKKHAKQCALICVDEMLKVIPMYTGNLNPRWKFYNEVKQEIEKPFSLTNRDINVNHRDYKFHLMLSDFRGAFAYLLISQETQIDLDIKKPLDAFTKYLKQKHFKSNGTVKEFTYDQLRNLISEDIFIAIPEVMELNEMKPDFYDLGALARNVFYMICREQITQPL